MDTSPLSTEIIDAQILVDDFTLSVLDYNIIEKN